MKNRMIASLRLVGPPLDAAADAVDWLVAVQAQDYAAAKWSLGLRLGQASDTLVERAFNDGANIGGQVAMRQAHAFRIAGTARRILHKREIVAATRDGITRRTTRRS